MNRKHRSYLTWSVVSKPKDFSGLQAITCTVKEWFVEHLCSVWMEVTCIGARHAVTLAKGTVILFSIIVASKASIKQVAQLSLTNPRDAMHHFIATGPQMRVCYVEIGDIRYITRYISKTVQDTCVEWWHCRWPWVTPNVPNPPILYIFYRLIYS